MRTSSSDFKSKAAEDHGGVDPVLEFYGGRDWSFPTRSPRSSRPVVRCADSEQRWERCNAWTLERVTEFGPSKAREDFTRKMSASSLLFIGLPQFYLWERLF